MPTVYDVPADVLIQKLAVYLKENIPEVAPPQWAPFVKTGSHVERPPQNPDWWYTRCASILRKVYLKGPIGVSRLRSEYGGRVRGHSRDGGGAIVRKALQQLEKAGYVIALERRGKILTNEGRSLIDSLAGKVVRTLEAGS